MFAECILVWNSHPGKHYRWQNRGLSFQIVAVYFNPPQTCMLIAVPTQLAGSYVGDDLDPSPGGILLPGSLGEGDVLNFAHQIAKGLHHLEKLKVRWRYVFYCYYPLSSV